MRSTYDSRWKEMREIVILSALFLPIRFKIVTMIFRRSLFYALDPPCVPFWRMPSNDSGTNLTYANANTFISGNSDRSVCVYFKASSSNIDHILLSIGPLLTGSISCNKHFAIAIANATHITIYGMCGLYDNLNINVAPSSLHDGLFHQICVSYNSTNSRLCVYRDSQTSTCFTRTNPPYSTQTGDVRIGWWPDNNRPFLGTQGGLIKSASLFNSVISTNCVAFMLNTYN